MTYLFSATTFLSSFLLFTIQLIVGKRILPWFGGVASVWTATMLFFMTILFLGYLYVNFISSFSKKIQVKIHLFLIGLSFVSTALNYLWFHTLIFPNPDWSLFRISPPTLHILLLVFFSIGIPFFLLSTTSTLLQYWFAELQPKKSPYSLYITSNIGSLLGLLSYPLLIEPRFSITSQENLWLVSFLVYLFFIIRIVKSYLHLKSGEKTIISKLARPPFSETLPWLALSTTSNVALLATTSHITQSVSPIPFLWIVPLALFLISYIIAFSGSHWYSRKFHGSLLLFSVFVTILATSGYIEFPYWVNLGIIFFSLFMMNLICHAELFRTRPAAKSLVPFYVAISLGGVIASLFCAVLAPTVFPDLWEFPLSLLFAIFVYLLVMLSESEHWLQEIQHLVISVIIMILALIQFQTLYQTEGVDPDANNIYKSRNFYGVLKISDELIESGGYYRSLVNGSILHGNQIINGTDDFVPTSYYQRDSGAGLVIDGSPQRKSKQPMRLGVIGLGSGTMAAYCQPGDYLRFYEINPEVVKLSENYFTYTAHCKKIGGMLDVILGDARLSLEKELVGGNSQKFDVLVVDAFTDDAIPIHLLTKEAIKLYSAHLADRGVLAFHISNRYLSLDKILDQESAMLGYYVNKQVTADSNWYLASPSPLKTPLVFSTVPADPKINLWTDDYSDILQILK